MIWELFGVICNEFAEVVSIIDFCQKCGPLIAIKCQFISGNKMSIYIMNRKLGFLIT